MRAVERGLKSARYWPWHETVIFMSEHFTEYSTTGGTTVSVITVITAITVGLDSNYCSTDATITCYKILINYKGGTATDCAQVTHSQI